MVNFTLRQLEIFSTAATYSSFSLAAKYLHMSKPAITKQIQVLESQLSIKLFEKHGRGMRLTRQAKRLLPQVKTILEEANKMKKAVELGFDQSKPMLTFTAGHTYSRLLFNAMKHFSAMHEVEYEMFIEPNDRGSKRLEDGKATFWVSSMKIDNPDLIYVPFFHINFYLVGSLSNPSIPTGRVKINELCDLPFIQIKAEHYQKTLQTKNEYVKKHFKKIIQLESYYSIKEAIKSNLGIGIVPETLLQDDSHKLHVLPIKELQFSRPVYLVTDKETSYIKDLFIHYIKTDFQIHPLD